MSKGEVTRDMAREAGRDRATGGDLGFIASP